MKPIVPGALLAGRFEVARSLGTGGLAEVWEARDAQSGQLVALKVLHAHLARDPLLVERFRREMQVARSLAHPSIVRVFDLHEHEGCPFLSMELLRGETLAERIRRGPLPAEEARRVLSACCDALGAAHARGVVHRDVKPQNVFLTEQGAVKLLDFGLARVMGAARLTATSTIMGTPGYLAPEVLRGEQADGRADLYALGVTFVEMLTGQSAFRSSELTAVMREQEAPRAPDPRLGPADDAIVRRALEADPERRFLDAAQLRRALAGFEPPPARDVPPALVAGDHEIVVQDRTVGGGRVARVLRALGLEPPLSWRVRGGMLGGGDTLIDGVDAHAAVAFVRWCRERGLRASSRPRRPPTALRRRLARYWWAIAGALVTAMLSVSLYSTMLRRGDLLASLALMGQVGAVFSLGIWSWLTRGTRPVLTRLPAGAPSVWRLVQRIHRTAGELEQVAGSVPELRALAAAAQRAADASTSIAAADPEAPTVPTGVDLQTTRLLAIAAALDDALAASATGASAERLREADVLLREALRPPQPPPEAAAPAPAPPATPPS